MGGVLLVCHGVQYLSLWRRVVGIGDVACAAVGGYIADVLVARLCCSIFVIAIFLCKGRVAVMSFVVWCGGLAWKWVVWTVVCCIVVCDVALCAVPQVVALRCWH